ncbi:hypothetical protein BGZ63DRAFT_360499 [Mariannaea sp. PMI_226]|nr:hypothetical protein BGZ63DRAFT_360499 [Mariannaea sp. PMI_226]
MSMLATANPLPHPNFGAPRPWEVTRCPDYSLRPRSENDRVALPSIRQAFPELQLQPQPQDVVARPAQALASTPTSLMGTTPSEYTYSPNDSKRRRLSNEVDRDNERARQIPRLYYGEERASSRQVSPSRPLQASQESWSVPQRSSTQRPSPYPQSGSIPLEMKDRTDSRPSLSSLPPPRSLEREPAPVTRLPSSMDGYRNSQPPPMPPHSVAPVPEPAPSSYHESNYAYPYHHPNRYQSLSAGSVQAPDRTPFTAGGYPVSYPDYGSRYNNETAPGDSKQRKRRGNLPKETTDKLRAWFMAHLQHPYPTEDEKQDLMRQTGLQMNQISNWFINARRRQLPTMINNARVESDAMTGVRVIATTEHGDLDHRSKRESAISPLSDSDGATYDEDMETLKHRRANMSRGSV